MDLTVNRSCLVSMILLIMMSIDLGCSHLSNLAVTDLSSQYNIQEKPESFECLVEHQNDSISLVSVRFPQSKLSADNSKSIPGLKRTVRLTYILYHSFKDPDVMNSGSALIDDSLFFDQEFLTHQFNIKAPIGFNYLLNIELIDLAKNHKYFLVKSFSKQNRSCSPWFTCINENREKSFDHLVKEDENVSILCCDESIRKLMCKCFFRNFPPALPPFIEKNREPFDYLADSIFFLDVHQGNTGYFRLPRQGFYLFQSDTTTWDGITLLRTYQEYPLVNSSRGMIEPLKYLTSSQEFDIISSGKDTKESLDSFWVANSGGVARALELIRSYYNRVELANRLFVSFCEGWKTDRGIIYIIFGPPNVVYRSDTQELWTYGEANNYRSLEFVFYKVLNPFTDNDYILQRQSNYKTYWYNAVQQWRR
jgi:GWxTD domain-containing protein